MPIIAGSEAVWLALISIGPHWSKPSMIKNFSQPSSLRHLVTHEKQRSSQRKCREHISNLSSHHDNATHQGWSGILHQPAMLWGKVQGMFSGQCCYMFGIHLWPWIRIHLPPGRSQYGPKIISDGYAHRYPKTIGNAQHYFNLYAQILSLRGTRRPPWTAAVSSRIVHENSLIWHWSP